MAEIEIYNPESLGAPLGQYCHVARVKATEFLFIAGSLSANKAGDVVGANLDFEAQCDQVFGNIEKVLIDADAGWGNVVQFTTYLINSNWIPQLMEYRLKHFPGMFKDGRYPPNTLLMVDRLVKEQFIVEVQAIAAI